MHTSITAEKGKYTLNFNLIKDLLDMIHFAVIYWSPPLNDLQYVIIH